jgi:hypothetical protein
MNEKLLELADTAGITWAMQTDFDIKNMEKFAELIIKECIDVINNDIKYNQLILHNDTSYKIHNMASLTGVIGKIKQHFRIE